ncbi:MAG: hypothetical protein JW751_12035 [Polyangiaceae bacterium]|nr:hypothetical protein [Polyangiaceae bacterium]
MHNTLTGTTVLMLTLAAGTAAAQEFGEQGTLAFSADRLFGLYLTHRGIDGDNEIPDDDDDVTEVGLLWQRPGITPFTVPRLSVDYFVINHLSVGGSIGFAHSDDEDDDDDDETYNAFYFGPRVGGAWMFADWAGIWPRGGFSFYAIDAWDTDMTQFVLNVEAMFVLAPTDHFAFTIGPMADIGLFGKYDPPRAGDGDLHVYAIGLGAGLMGYLNL